MGDWTPLARAHPIKAQEPDVVRLTPGSVLTMSADLVTRFRPHQHVTPLRNGNSALVGLRGAEKHTAGIRLALSGVSRSSAGISFTGTLRACGKAAPRRAVDLPHHWDGDVLVLDLSGLPDATGRL